MKLKLGRRAVKFLDTLQPRQFRQVVMKVLALLSDPEPIDSKQLTGHPWRRADVGEYRIIYRTEADVLHVPLIGKRNDDEVYRDLERMQ